MPHPRTIVLLAACACAFVVMAIGFQWSIFDLDDGWVRRDYAGWLGAALFLFAASFLPLWDWIYRRYYR